MLPNQQLQKYNPQQQQNQNIFPVSHADLIMLEQIEDLNAANVQEAIELLNQKKVSTAFSIEIDPVTSRIMFIRDDGSQVVSAGIDEFNRLYVTFQF